MRFLEPGGRKLVLHLKHSRCTSIAVDERFLYHQRAVIKRDVLLGLALLVSPHSRPQCSRYTKYMARKEVLRLCEFFIG